MRRIRSVLTLLSSLVLLIFPIACHAQNMCLTMAPPELPVYEQPAIPASGYLWSPGYWGYGEEGYFWVPGTWVEPPAVGLLWTPGYWAFRDGNYVWNAGYWGPHVGFYGGVYYGFGYDGVGYEGGRWENGVFAYNRTVNNFGSVTITNVYEKTVVVAPGASRVSFNGGSGGTAARPTPQQEAAAREQHLAASPAQFQHVETASTNKALLASANHGQPAIAATAKPNEFSGKGVVAVREVKPNGAVPGTNAPPMGQRPGAPALGAKPGEPPQRLEKPANAATITTEPNGRIVPEKKGPASAPAPLNAARPGAATPEKDKKEAPNGQAKLNGDRPAKPATPEAKPVTVPPPPRQVRTPPPPPVAAAKPPAPPPAKSAAKPACPPGKTLTPAGCK